MIKMTDKKPLYIIAVEYHDHTDKVFFDNLSHFSPRATFIKTMMANGKAHRFDGTNCDVIIIDTWQEFSEKQCKKLAELFVKGDYNVWSYRDETWTKGEKLI